MLEIIVFTRIFLSEAGKHFSPGRIAKAAPRRAACSPAIYRLFSFLLERGLLAAGEDFSRAGEKYNRTGFRVSGG
jgi:hypothetical protein